MGKKAALIIIAIFLVVPSCKNRGWEANALNEEGINLHSFKRYEPAGIRFEESISFRYKSEIPAYNMGNNYFRKGDYISAHEYYQRALKLEPGFVNAVFNDGCALFMEGISLLDRDYCNIAETVSYLKNARERFLDSSDMESDGRLIPAMSKKNADYITGKIEEIEKKHLENSGKCRAKSNYRDSSENSEENSGNSGSKGRPNPGSDYGGSALSDSEKEKVKVELERIRKEASEASFSQTKPQQIRRGMGKENSAKEGELISW